MKASGVLACVFIESTRRDKNTFRRFFACSRTHKILNLFAANIVLPTLRLNVNHVETKAIFVNYSVDACIAAFLSNFSSLTTRTAISHCNQKIEHNLLEPKRVYIRKFSP